MVPTWMPWRHNVEALGWIEYSVALIDRAALNVLQKLNSHAYHILFGWIVLYFDILQNMRHFRQMNSQNLKLHNICFEASSI
jgi:hypothetical protein